MNPEPLSRLSESLRLPAPPPVMRIKPSRLTAILSCTLAAFFSGASIAVAQAPSNVVAHYRFEDGPGAVGTILDSGPNLLHGTSAGTLSYSTDRASLPATGNFSLDALGDMNFAQIPNNALLHQQGDFTVEMFIKVDAPYDDYGSPGFSTFAVKLNTAEGGSFLGGFEFDYGLSGNVGGSISFGGGAGVGFGGPALVNDGKWHHIALVMDRDVSGSTDQLRFYVDGVLDSITQGVWPNLFYGDQPLYIGAGNFLGPGSSYRRNFDGYIDEFRLTSAALTPAEFLAPATVTVPTHHTSAWNSTTGNWSDPTKWSTPTAPGTFPNNSASTYDAVQSGGALTVDQAIAIQKFTMNGGTNTGGGFDLTANDVLTLGGGMVNGSGAINALGGAAFGPLEMAGRTINLGDGSGPVVNTTWSSGDPLVHSGLVINNKSDSNFIVGFDGGSFGNINRGGSMVFNNEGTFTKNGGAGTAIIGGVNNGSSTFSFNNSGTVQVNSGTLALESTGGTLSGAFQIANGATLDFRSGFSGTRTLAAGATYTGAGTLLFSGVIDAAAATTVDSSLNITGMLTGPGPLTANGNLTLTGVLTGSANVTATGDVTFNGDGRQIIEGAVLNLGDGAGPDAGSTTTWSSGNIVMGTSSTINNRSDSVINATADNSMYSNFNGAAVAFNNEGTFNQNGTGTTTLGGNSNPFVFSNSGLIQVNSGNLVIATGVGSSGTNTGDFVIASGAALILGTMNLNAGTTFTGAGTTVFAGAITASGATTLDTTLTFTGTLDGGPLDINGPFFCNGKINGVGSVNAKGGVTFDGDNREIAYGRVLNLGDGVGPTMTANWTGGEIGFRGNTNSNVINNRSDSEFITTFNGNITNATYNSTATFNNEGIFTKSGGTGETIIGNVYSVDFNNSGTVNANSGTIRFNTSYTQTAGALVLNGGSVSGGTFAIRGGKIQGSGTITGAVSVSTTNGVTFEPGIGTTTGTLAITGDLILLNTNSKFRFDISGTTPGIQHDQLLEGGSAVFNVGGVTLEVNLPGSYLPAAGDTFTVVDGSGARINGSFANAPNGARIASADGKATFKVNYGDTTAIEPKAFNADKVILSDFRTTPTSLTLGDNQIVENAPLGTVVGLLSATDPNAAATFTFTLVAGAGDTGNGQFQIAGNQLQAKAGLDFETKTSYSVRLRVTNNGGGFLEQTFTIQVQDVPNPTALALSSNTFPENKQAGHVIGALSATNPPGGGDPVTFTVVSVDGSTTAPLAFTVSDSNLVTNKANFDFETAPGPFNVLVKATNLGGESASQTLAVSVTDEGPTALALSTSSILEGKANAPVGDLSVTTIVPAGTAISTWELLAGAADNARFTLDGTTVKTAATALDFEDAPTRSIRVKATDANGESFEQDLAITVGDVAVTDITLSGTAVLENVPAGTVIANLGTVINPADPEATATFSIVSATPNDALSVTGNQLVTARPLLRSATRSLAVRLRAEHLGEGIEEDVTITVNANEGRLVVQNSQGTIITSLNVGDLALGTTATRTVTLRNPGPGHVFNVGIRNPIAPNNDASAASTALVTDDDLAPGESVAVEVGFIPQALGNRSSRIVFESDNAPDRSFTITGRGIGAEISVQHPLDTELVDGAPLDFGAQPIGVSFPARSFIVENVGTLTSLGSIAATITGPDAAFFVLDTQGFASSLAAGDGSALRVKFQPDALRAYHATLSIASTDSDENPFSVPLTGTGMTPLMIAQTAYAKADVARIGSNLGRAVAVSGNTVVVSAPLSGQTNLSLREEVHVFVKDSGSGEWSPQAVLRTPPGIQTGRDFGSAVAISGDTVVVGNVLNAPVAVFQRTGTTWALQALLTPPRLDVEDRFGGAVAISGDTVVVGADLEDSDATGVGGDSASNAAPDSGSAYIFERSGGSWTLSAYVKASNTDRGDRFGVAVALSGNTLAVGAYREDGASAGVGGSQNNNLLENAGAVYLFERVGGVWNQSAYLKASNPGLRDEFGARVALSGDLLVVGAEREDGGASGVNGPQNLGKATLSGAAYVFRRDTGSWVQEAYLKASSPSGGDLFGGSVAVSGNRVLVAARVEGSASFGINGNGPDQGAPDSGAAYLFEHSGGAWVQQAVLKASNTEAFDQFGFAVALDGGVLVAGARFEDSNATGINGDGSNNNATDSGAAYIFEITPPEVFVHDGPDTGSPKLADGQAAAVDFGITLPGQQVTRAFTIQNVRALPLTVTGITAPPGYAVVAVPADPLAPQESATFFLHLTAEAPGTFSGPVTVSTNDSANPEFVFPVTGGVQNMTPGSLDLRFGTGGVVRADFNDSDDRAYAMTQLEDGRFVLAGRTTSGVLTDYAVLCLRPDGSVDPSFGDSGWATGTVAGFPAAGVSITGLAVQDGRILAAACPPEFLSGPDRTFALMRLLPDGAPDATFGTGGVALDGSAAAAFTTGDVAVTASGKILVAGSLQEILGTRAYIRRFNQNGSLDTGFASPAGLLRLPGPGAGQCLVQNAAGEIFIGGRATTTGRLSVWRTSSGGVQLDVGTFPGIAPADYPAEGAAPEFETVSALALQTAGKPVFAARRTAGLDRDTGHGFIAGQMSGTLDPDVTFAATGAVLTDLVAGVNKEQANSVAVQADGRVVVAGRAGDEIAVLRYLPNGLPDSTFGTAGRVMIPVGPGASAYKVIVDAAGDLYVAGHAGGPGANSQDFVLLKLIGSNDQQPAIAVQRSSAPGFPAVTSGQAQPVEYGVTRVTSPKTIIFFVRNTGTAPLTISNVSVPPGYRVAFLNANIPAGGTGEIQIQLTANAIGTFGGTVGIASNDPVLGTFTFPVTGQVLPNSAPVYTPLTIETVEGKPATLLLDKLLQQVTDPDGDPVNLTSFPLLSAKGAAIARVEKSLVFTQPVPLAGTDTFEVRFSDGFRIITGQVTVVVATDPGLNPKNAPRVTKLPDGNVSVSFSGIARRTYSIQQTTDGVNFNVLGTATADRVGDVKFVTSTPPPINSMFRIRQL